MLAKRSLASLTSLRLPKMESASSKKSSTFDLSQVVDKYIGESEKRLEHVYKDVGSNAAGDSEDPEKICK